MNPEERDKEIKALKKQMERAAKDLDFIAAAQHRDELMALKEKWKMTV